MKLLLTGGCGYIGTMLTRELLADGHELTIVDAKWFGDFLDPHERLRVIEADVRDVDRIPMDGVEAILHLANVANDPCGDIDSKLTWEVNVLASMLLIEKAIEDGVGQFIYASSGSVYGVKEEDEVTEELPLVPISDYNKTKMVSERVLLSYADQIVVQCVRPATVCGVSPRMRLDLSVNMLAMQALTNGRITVFGGDQTRPNIHIRDMVRVYQHFLAKGDAIRGVFNAGFENLSIMEIAERVTETAPAEIVVTESDDPRSYRLSSRKLLATGFEPAYTVQDGIDEVAEAFRSGKLEDDPGCYNIKTMNRVMSNGGA